MATAPAVLGAVAERVDARLAEFLTAETKRWSDLDPDLVPFFESLSSFALHGGKRLRGAFCTLGFVAAGGGESDPSIVNASAAFELLHAFALLHDDVMDGSAMRRGAQTMHLRFASDHENQNWRGESRRFGEGIAIIIGDLAFVCADRLLGAVPPPAIEIWNEMRVELNVGQFLDLMGTVRGTPTLDAAERIVRYKSAKYTVQRPLQLGAALGAHLAELEPWLTAYGMAVGEAFQLRDDVLGAFGDSSVTGKPAGDDLREGKPTPLLALAWSCADRTQRLTLGTTGARLDAHEIEAIRRVIVDTGALAAIEARISELTQQAIASLDRSPLPASVRADLIELARFIADRSQ